MLVKHAVIAQIASQVLFRPFPCACGCWPSSAETNSWTETQVKTDGYTNYYLLLMKVGEAGMLDYSAVQKIAQD